jgi:AcrR family transcriptional regulator
MTVRATTRAAARTAAPTPASARRLRDHARVRREVLLAAAGVFARHGYAAATLADLAEAAGYAPPSLYRYFASKEEIFVSLMELLKAELHATFEAPVDAARPLASRLEALLGAQFALVRERREVFAVLLAERPALTHGARPFPDLRAGVALYEAQIAAWLERHASPRELRCPVPLAARALAGLAHAFHHCQVAHPDPTPPAEQARVVIDLALHGVLATPRSK